MVYPASKTKPWKHQVEALDLIKKNRAFYLMHEMGVGKSKVAVDACTEFDCKKILIICPHKVINVWPLQFELHSSRDVEVIPLVKGTATDKANLVEQKLRTANHRAQAFVVNFESCFRPPLGPTVDKFKKVKKPGVLIKHRWDMMIIDEAHRIKSPSGRASWQVYRLGKLNRRKLFLSGTSMPHALSDSSNLLTPSGWKRIKDFKIGDYVVGVDGNPTKVIGVWPQGKQELFKIIFSDGSNVTCTKDHLWNVKSRGRRSRNLDSFIMRTDDLEKPFKTNGKGGLFQSDKSARWHIPMHDLIKFEERSLPIDPYLFGVLIGDGHLGHPVDITSADQQIIDEIKKVLPAGLKLKKDQKKGKSYRYRISSGKKGGSLKGKIRGPAPNPLYTALDNLGIRNKNSYERWIPSEYLWNSIENRIALIQGLFDTDGSSCGSTSKFTTTSEGLCDDVIFLIRSLGGFAKKSIELSKKVVLPNGTTTIGRTKFNIFCRTAFNPFRLKRKADKFKVPWRKPRKNIVGIYQIEDGYATCITVEAQNGLYITEDFVVTHNSPLDIYAQYRALDPTIFNCNFTQFRARYAVMGGYLGKQIFEYQNIEDLNRKMFQVAHEVLADNVLELPPKVDRELIFDLNPDTMAIYKSLEKDMIAEWEHGEMTADNMLVKLLRLSELTCGIVTDDKTGRKTIIDKSKAETVVDFLEDIPPKEPVIIYCKFTPELRLVKNMVEKSGRSVAEVSGSKNELEIWQKGERNTLVLQIDAGSEGIDLTRARYCIYSSTGLKLGVYRQSRRRIRRPGQNQKVFYYHILGNRTIDIGNMRALREKKEVVDFFLRGLYEYKKTGIAPKTKRIRELALSQLIGGNNNGCE